MPQYNRETLTWGSYDGREILIKDLEVRHLVNILNHIAETNKISTKTMYPRPVVLLLEAEAELRIMAGWAANLGIPRKNEYGRWELINQTADEKAIEDAKTALHQAGLRKAQAENQRLSRVELIRQTLKIQGLTEPEIAK